MLVLVAIWALAEAVLFFIVADVPIMAVGIKYGHRKAALAAVIGALFAATGGLIVMQWAAADPAGSRTTIEAVPGISAALMNSAAADWNAGGWQAMLAGSFSGVPYKLYAHAAGVTGAGMAAFFFASIAARLPRFLLVGALAATMGPVVRRRIGAWEVWVIFGAAWTGFYIWYLSVMAN